MIIKKVSMFLFFITLITLFPNETDALENGYFETLKTEAKILEIVSEEIVMEPISNTETKVQIAKAKILSGKYKDRIITIENTFYFMESMRYQQISLEEELTVVLEIEIVDDEIVKAYVFDYSRDTYTYSLIFIFIFFLLIFGKSQGFKSVITLGLTLLLIFKFMIPLLYQGYNPVYLVLITGTIITTITFVIVCGLTSKTLAAIVGTSGGLASATIISIIFTKILKLSGIHSEDEQMLLTIPEFSAFDFKGLLLAGIIIGALGAIMDVAISIASAMEEVKNNKKDIKTAELFKSGMNVGKDIMGTMANTLILAYVGATLPLLMLLYAFENKFSELIHMEFLVVEILRTTAGSIGLILSIPITAVVTTALLKRNKK